MIVYILTNECMPDTKNIGIPENLDQRMAQLDNTSVPLPFECFFAVDVDGAVRVKKKMHQGLDEHRIRNNREFFNISPEKAESLQEIAGGQDVTPSQDIVDTPQDLKALENAELRGGDLISRSWVLKKGLHWSFLEIGQLLARCSMIHR